MGQKVNPIGFRVGVNTANKTWSSVWFDETNYADKVHEDLNIRKIVYSDLKNAGVSKVEIERLAGKVNVLIHTPKPGVVIGKKGSDIGKIKSKLQKEVSGEVQVSIVEVRKPELDAALVAQSIATQLEKRISFRRAMKKSIQSAMKMNAKGIRINCSGRLGGAEIARMEWYREGRVPLHTIRADIDYGVARADTTYGVIGVKVWICRGDNREDLHKTKKSEI